MCLALALLSSRAVAQDRTSLSPDLAPVGDPAFSVQAATTRGHGLLRVGITGSYQREPFVLTTAAQELDHVVVEQAFLHAQVAGALWHRLLLFGDLPLGVLESGDGAGFARSAPRAGSGVHLGEASFGGRFGLLGPSKERGFDLAVAGKAWVPTGATSAYTGGDGFRGRLGLIAGLSASRFVGSFEGGVFLRGEERYTGVLSHRLGSSIVAGVAAAYLLDAKRTLSVGPELVARSVFASASVLDPRSTGVELWLSSRFRPWGGPWTAGAGLAAGLGQGIGTPDYRALLSAAFAPERAPPPADRDADAVIDAHDACPDLAGVPAADPVMHGCPDLPKDRDGDSIPDGYDACPSEPGEPTGHRRTHGCPPLPDLDGDREPDLVDACPKVAGIRSKNPAANGCLPPPPRVQLTKNRIVISEQVHFETGTAVIRRQSDPLLGAVADVLVQHPEVELVEVRGHTDDTGSTDVNRRLSTDRARAVLAWLVRRGIAPGRLEARGLGAERPLGDNDTEEGRAKNRRVEFVVRRTTAGEVPEP